MTSRLTDERVFKAETHTRATHPKDYWCGPYGCNICQLFICDVCGGGEGSLPSECPKIRMTIEQQDAVYAGTLDFVDGKWITE